MKNYSIDHTSNTIICTKKFLMNSKQLDTPECAECQELRTAFPDYTFCVREIRIKEGKQVPNKNLTYANMVRYAASQPDGPEKLVEFAKIRNLSGQKGNNYNTVKTWFLNNYPAYVIPGVSDKELENAERFISLDMAREMLNEFANCETVDEIRDVITTHLGESKKNVLPLDKVS